MKHNLQRLFIWIAALLTSIPAVFAADALDTILQPVINLIGPEGFWGLYFPYALFWDSIIALLFFLGVTGTILQQRFGKLASASVAIMLTVGFIGLEGVTGWRLADLAPIAAFVLLLTLGGFVYEAITRWGANRWVAFSAAYVTIWLTALMLSKVIFGDSAEDNTVYAIVNALGGIAIISLAIWAATRLFGGHASGGGTGLFGGGHGGGGHGGSSGALRTHDLVEDDIQRQLAEITKQQQRGAQHSGDGGNARQALEQLQRALQADMQIELTSAKTLGELQELIESTGRSVDQSTAVVKQLAANPAFDYAGYKQKLQQDYVPQLQAFLDRQQEDFKAIQQDFLQPSELEKDAALEKEVHKQIEKEELTEFDADKAFIERLRRQESLISASMEEARAVVDHPPPRGFGVAERVVKRFVEADYKLHLHDLAEVQHLYSIIQQGVESIRANHQRIQDLVAQRHKIREHQKATLEEMPKLFAEYWPAVMTAFSDLTSDEAVKRAHEHGEALLKKVAELEEGNKQRGQMEEEINGRITSLEEYEPRHLQLQNEFLTALQHTEVRAAELESIATTVLLIGEAAQQVGELDPQHAGLQAAGIAVDDLRAGRLEANLKKAQKLIESRLDKTIKEIARHRERYKGTPQEAAFAEAEDAELKLRQELYAKWENHIKEETLTAEEQRKQAAQLNLHLGAQP